MVGHGPFFLVEGCIFRAVIRGHSVSRTQSAKSLHSETGPDAASPPNAQRFLLGTAQAQLEKALTIGRFVQSVLSRAWQNFSEPICKAGSDKAGKSDKKHKRKEKSSKRGPCLCDVGTGAHSCWGCLRLSGSEVFCCIRADHRPVI